MTGTSRFRTWPLTGRVEELQRIEAAVETPDTSGIVVSGAAGVGKSRIVRDALALLADKGYVTRWAVASSSARSMPLGAFTPWMVSATTDDTQLVQLVRGVIEALTAAPDGRTAVIAVDDVHLLDDLSTFVLHQIVQRGAAKVLLTLRSSEVIPAGVQEIWKGFQLGRLDLQPLSRNETSALLSAVLGGPIDPDAARRLWALTRGNALYLRNIVEQEASDGRLAQLHGTWRWTGDPVVPPDLADMIQSRMGSLREDVLEVVDVLAVGEPLDLEALINITDVSAVENADLHELITISPVGPRIEARLAHPLYGEVRRNRAPLMRMRRLRSAVAAELGAAHNADDLRLVVRRAALILDSDTQPEPELLTRAANGAMWLADAQLADRLAQAAIAAGAGVDAYNIRAFALSWQGLGRAADSVMASIPAADLTGEERVYLLGHRAFNTLWGLADPDKAGELFDEAARIAPASARTWVDAYRSVYAASMARPEATRALSKNFEIDLLPPIIGSAAAWALVVAHGDSGHTTDALTAADNGYTHWERTAGAPHMLMLIVDKHVGALLQAGEIEKARAVAERARKQTADLPGVALLLGAGITGRAALGAGRLEEACELLEPTVQMFMGDANGFRYRFLIPLATALAMRGMRDAAAGVLRAADDEYHRSWRFVDYEREIARAWVAAAGGAVVEAASISLSAAHVAADNGQFAAEVMCLQALTQFGDRQGAERLAELTRVVEGGRVHAAAKFAQSLSTGDGDQLNSAADDFETMGDLVAAMDAASYAALAYRGKDLNGSALTASARVDSLAQRCGGSTPASLKAAQPLPLTDREREVGLLLGEGLSSRAIADRLTLSVRTVEGHIYRAMTKTGAEDRDQLARMCGRRSAIN